MKHTPAPWTKEWASNGYEINAGGDNPDKDTFTHIAIVIEDQDEEEETEANARLIAAAPELLEALELILEETLIDADDKVLALIALGEIRFAARAAIAKAKGES